MLRLLPLRGMVSSRAMFTNCRRQRSAAGRSSKAAQICFYGRRTVHFFIYSIYLRLECPRPRVVVATGTMGPRTTEPGLLSGCEVESCDLTPYDLEFEYAALHVLLSAGRS